MLIKDLMAAVEQAEQAASNSAASNFAPDLSAQPHRL